MAEENNFWNEVMIAETLHYHDGCGKYVRGKVMENVFDDRTKYVFLPIGLVGNWTKYDLPGYGDNGQYWSGAKILKNIEEGIPFRPQSTSIFECEDFIARAADNTIIIDPGNLPLIDTRCPTPTEEMQKIIELHEFTEAIRQSLTPERVWNEDYKELYLTQLAEAKSLIDQAAAKFLPHLEGAIPTIVFSVQDGVGTVGGISGSANVVVVNFDNDDREADIEEMLTPERIDGDDESLESALKGGRAYLKMTRDPSKFPL